MTENAIVLLLVLYIVARESFFLYSTHKLVNKIMSHNYHDYQQSAQVRKTEPKAPTFAPPEFEDDLGILQGIGIL